MGGLLLIFFKFNVINLILTRGAVRTHTQRKEWQGGEEVSANAKECGISNDH